MKSGKRDILERLSILCLKAERAIERYIFKKLDKKNVSDIDIAISVDSIEPLAFTIELSASTHMPGKNLEVILDEAIKKGFEKIDSEVKSLKAGAPQISVRKKFEKYSDNVSS